MGMWIFGVLELCKLRILDFLCCWALLLSWGCGEGSKIEWQKRDCGCLVWMEVCGATWWKIWSWRFWDVVMCVEQGGGFGSGFVLFLHLFLCGSGWFCLIGWRILHCRSLVCGCWVESWDGLGDFSQWDGWSLEAFWRKRFLGSSIFRQLEVLQNSL